MRVDYIPALTVHASFRIQVDAELGIRKLVRHPRI